jgi:hypothetical protein
VDSFLAKLRGQTLEGLRVAADASLATLGFSGGWEVELQEATDVYEPGSDLVRVFDHGQLAAAVRYPGGLAVASTVMNETRSMTDMMRSTRRIGRQAATGRFITLNKLHKRPKAPRRNVQ